MSRFMKKRFFLAKCLLFILLTVKKMSSMKNKKKIRTKCFKIDEFVQNPISMW